MINTDYSLIFKDDHLLKPKMNEPFHIMRSDVVLHGMDFSIWKSTNNHQNIHTHDYYQLWYIFRGSCKHMINNQIFNLSYGDIIVIPPFFYHSMHNGSDDLIVVALILPRSFFLKATSATKLYCLV